MASPPEWMQPGESSLADGARDHIQDLHKKRSSRFSLSASPHTDKVQVAGDDKGKGKGKGKAPARPEEPTAEPVVVEVRDERKHKDDEGKSDLFRWATLFENQRGLTLFSTPYYSSRSLLLGDPPAFTVPDPGESIPSHPHHEAPPNITLSTYPLPDPTWRWVSKSWLVDMRGDGDVQHDGFEYNWLFRRNHWRAKVGWFGAGGYVRRRRWVRLMMRPSDTRLQAEAAVEDRRREDAVRDAPCDVESQDTRVWRGDEGDWDRLRKALKHLSRDGPKLELWADWLADFIGDDAPEPTHVKSWTEDWSGQTTPELQPESVAATDASPETRERPSREWIVAVLRQYGKDLGGLFIYPDSRAQLRDLLIKGGLAQDIIIYPSVPSSTTRSQLLGPADFWSRTSGLDGLSSSEAAGHDGDDKQS